MSKLRYFPFGYYMQNGSVLPHQEESVLVARIFEEYVAGHSLQQIAEGLNDSGVLYNENKPLWTKHMVRRILVNRHYYDCSFVPIITRDLFEQAYHLRESKSVTPTAALEHIRKLVVCADCNTRRQLDTHGNPMFTWVCTNCGNRSKPISSYALQAAIDDKLAVLLENPQMITVPVPPGGGVSLEMFKQQQEINRILEKACIDADALIEALHARAAMQYSLCDAGEYDPATLKLKTLFADGDLYHQDEKSLFKESVAAVLMDRQSNIQLKLINGQIL